jgi:hypothetical protein
LVLCQQKLIEFYDLRFEGKQKLLENSPSFMGFCLSKNFTTSGCKRDICARDWSASDAVLRLFIVNKQKMKIDQLIAQIFQFIDGFL